MAAGGREALLHMLLNRSLEGRDICRVPQTEALAAQKTLSRRGVDRLVEIIAHDGTLPCAHPIYADVAVTPVKARTRASMPAPRQWPQTSNSPAQ